MKTHRCEQSLANHCSIRNEKSNRYYRQDGWWLYMKEVNYDWDSIYMKGVAPIKFCPFCGKELGELNE